MKLRSRSLALVLSLLLCFGLGSMPAFAEGSFTRADAAVLLADAFDLVPIRPVMAEGQEEIIKVLGYENTAGAINESHLVPAAKDCVDLPQETQSAIESVINATVMPLTDDKLFAPDAPITEAEFALAIAKCLYGPDKDIDHLADAVAAGILPEASDAALTAEKAAELLAFTQAENCAILTVFATADIHGNFIPYKPGGSAVPVGSVARMATIINEMRAKKDAVLLIDAGDSPYNTNLANLTEGRASVDLYNAMGYDAIALGNHDFDMKFQNLLSLAERANYAMLSANTYWKDGTYPEQFKPYILKEIAGITVAVIGLTDDQSKLTTHYTNTGDIDFLPDIETGKALLAELEGKADVIICLSHLHGKNPALLEQVSGIDVSIGGGNDLAGRPNLIGDAWLINPGKHAEAINQINLNLIDGKLVGVLVSQIFLGEGYEEDATINNILAGYQKRIDTIMGRKIGELAQDLEWSALQVRTQEMPIANMVADALREYMEADIALQNGGGIRAALPGGDVTLSDIYGTLPFDNKVILVETSGQTLWDALENGVSSYPETAGKFLQVSGLSYTFDGAKPAGERMVSVTMPDGQPLDLAARYTVVINDFLGGGGDGYTMLNLFNKDMAVAEDVTLLIESRDYLRDVLHLYFQNHGTLDPQADGRIVTLNPQL